MATMQTTLETIFVEAAKVFGKAEAEKLLNKVFDVEKAPKVSKKTEEKKTVKRIARMTPTLANQLKTELAKVGITYTDDDKKDFDKIKKEFVSHVDGLTDDDFTAKGLADHMREFANLKKPSPAPVKEEVAKKKTIWEEINEVDVPPPPSNAATIHTLSLEDLQKIEMIGSPEGGPVGVFWDADDGRWVRGPGRDDDEELTEKKFKGKDYAIGDKTGRVYEITDDKDVFVGFAGVGLFKELK